MRGGYPVKTRALVPLAEQLSETLEAGTLQAGFPWRLRGPTDTLTLDL